MLSFVVWWAAADLLAFAAFPLAFRLLRNLPDRGYTAAKPLGIILAAFIFWLAGALGLLGNDRGSVVLVLLIALLAGLFFAGRQRRPLIGFLEANLRYVLTVEALFLAVFAWFTWLRSYAPDIAATEKPFELAFLNGVTRSPYFPPPDPWLSGYVMNYYYLGWVNVDFLGRLTQTSNAIGFNLGTPLTAALAAVAIFGLVFGLVRHSATGGMYRRAVIFGLAAAVLLLVASNLEGVLELLAAHGVGSAGLYNAIGVIGLTTGKKTPTWYPTEFWFWWRATRMGSGYNIMEFPYFSFMLADLHPHVMVMPFTLLGLSFVWNLLAGEGPLDGHWWRRSRLHLVVLAILLGALGLLNAWDQPAAVVMLFLAALLANHRRLGTLSWPLLRASLLFVLPIVVLSFVLYLPYWGVFERTDIVGLSSLAISTLPAGEARASMATPPLHLLLFWGPLFWPVLTFLIVHLRRTASERGRSPSAWEPGRGMPRPYESEAAARPSQCLERTQPAGAAYVLWPLAAACLPLLLWAFAVAGQLGLSGLVVELGTRGGGLLTELILTALLFLSLAALMREALPERGRRADAAVLFALVCASIGILWILGAELFWVVESSVALRYNTVFKLWYQAWMFESVAGAAGLAYVLRGWRLPVLARSPGRLAWAGVSAVILLGALVYPAIATPNRANGFAGRPTLNGLAFFQQDFPADYAAAAWLSANVQGTPVELEAEGGALAGNFSAEGGRISELTGLPTVLAWLEHDQIHHGIVVPLQQRSSAIRMIYTTSDPIIAHALLQQYNVQYVVVGDLERRVYGTAGLAKFAQMGAAVYRGAGITIYDITQPPPLSAAPGLPAGP